MQRTYPVLTYETARVHVEEQPHAFNTVDILSYNRNVPTMVVLTLILVMICVLVSIQDNVDMLMIAYVV
jgi:hypothetical protein